MTNDIRTETTLVTPEKAQAWLTRNELNTRPLNTRRVQRFANSMRNNDWVLTHQGIAFDSDGNILDGQTRLYAVVESGMDVLMRVTYNVDPSVFGFIDVGGPRSVGDVLSIAGHKNSAALGAALRLVYVYESGQDRPWGRLTSGLTPVAIERLAGAADDRMQPLIQTAARIRQRIGGSAAAIAAGLYVADKWSEDHDKADQFKSWSEGFTTGAGLEKGDARLAVASWLNGGAYLLKSVIRTEATVVATVRAFGAEVKGEQLQKLAFRDASTWMYRLPK